MTDSSDMQPDEIRAIRERLGLTQVEAGELIGGGPRAFTKYEAGAVTPAASVVNLLRVLDSNPDALETLGTRKPLPPAAGLLSPFEVSGDHIAVLGKAELPELLRRLLQVEVREHDLQLADIHVPSNIDAQDGGEDGRITWERGPDRTASLPSRRCHFQLKAGAITPARAGREVLAEDGAVKDMVRAGLEAGGHYVLLCAHSYTQKAIEDREARIRAALLGAGLNTAGDQIHFRDADTIAMWVNRHPSVATWVKERTAPGSVGPFQSWSQWASRADHEQVPWIDDERLHEVRTHLHERISTVRSATRVVGLPGLGKSRLILEGLGPDVATEDRGISDFILYASLSEIGEETAKRAVRDLADHRQRAIVVVDDCDTETQRDLARLASSAGSTLSLITIENENPDGVLDPDAVIHVALAPDEVTETLIRQLLPRVRSEDHRRLAHFSRGFPGIAIRIGQAWDRSVPLADAADSALVDAFVLGRRPEQPEILVKSAQLLATFGIVSLDPSTGGRFVEVARYGEVASHATDLSPEDFYAACVILADRGVLQRRGKAVVLSPGPIAMKLAERQWNEWEPNRWEGVLTGNSSASLKVQAVRRLRLLNPGGVAARVVERLCRPGGPFDGLEAACRPGRAALLPHLAEISPGVLAQRIDRLLDDADDLERVDGDLRRSLVAALERIAFHADTFEDGAALLLRLAVCENEAWSNNATGQFTDLFPMILGGTTAGAYARLAMLDNAAATDDPVQLSLVARALSAGCRTSYFGRMVGPESQGSRPALESWRPASQDEATEYVDACFTRLGTIGQRMDDAGVAAREHLRGHLVELIREGLIDRVEEVVREVAGVVDYWPEAASRLSDVLAFDSEDLDEGIPARISALLTELEPRSMEARVRSIVTAVPWHYDAEEGSERHYERAAAAVRGLAEELFAQPGQLREYLPRLSRDAHQMARSFGAAVAELAAGDPEWLERIVESVVGVPEDERSFDLLAGYVGWLATHRPGEAEAFKLRAAASPDLAPALPQLCVDPGVSPSDVTLMLNAVQAGVLPPQRIALLSFGGVLAGLDASDLAPLTDVMLDLSAEAYAVALDLMAMYAFGDLERLNGLRRQVVHAAESAGRWASVRGMHAQDYHFEQVMGWMLEKGRDDRDASSTALELAKTLVNSEDIESAERVRPLLRALLADFPEVVWPLVGQAIVSDRRARARAELMLGDFFSFGPRSNPALLQLPENTLFAWCHAHPESAPAFAARILPVLSPRSTGGDPTIHPWMSRLLDEFGDRDDVRDAVETNAYNFGWTGSMASYFVQYEAPLHDLAQHPRREVRRWAKVMQDRIGRSLDEARNEEEEEEALWDL